MEFAIGRQAFQSGSNILNSKLEQVNYTQIRKYFDISNSYVLEKLSLIVFPFQNKEISFGPSVYRPDMYIPIMSMISLILFRGLALGIAKKFHPEYLGLFFSRTLFIHLGLALIYKAASYLMDVETSFLDLSAYIGYKFVVIILVKLLSKVFLGWIGCIYLLVAYFFFFSRSLKNMISNPNHSQRNVTLIFGLALVELLVISLMAYYN